ncbi:hypothetical protein [Streptomyces sp. HPF1205]|uniref:hypothetical protein n=1 Tax=Streptomyces sp. HPF1205 TaxID=2873262 RepID=UPI0021F11211|nr:hypothetical protein [Streptomyces sp. HPF1205]
MNYLRGFLPWIAFAAVSAVGRQWGALAGLVLALWVVGRSRKVGAAADELILEGAGVLFFTALTALAFCAADSGLRHYTGALSMAWLAAVAWTTIAAKRPFTLGAARRQTPREIWRNPVFLRVNVVLSTAWAVGFTATAGALTAVSATHAGSAVSIPVQIAGFVLPAAFTARYTDRVRARAAAPATAGTAGTVPTAPLT